MPAHLGISEADAGKIVAWIQSLSEEGSLQASLPPSGEVEPTQGTKPTQNDTLILSASYTDEGGAGVKPLTGNTSMYLRNNTNSVRNVFEIRK